MSQAPELEAVLFELCQKGFVADLFDHLALCDWLSVRGPDVDGFSACLWDLGENHVKVEPSVKTRGNHVPQAKRRFGFEAV